MASILSSKDSLKLKLVAQQKPFLNRKVLKSKNFFQHYNSWDGTKLN
jgi:hypothetical protein